jgi:hypothetical protein
MSHGTDRVPNFLFRKIKLGTLNFHNLKTLLGARGWKVSNWAHIFDQLRVYDVVKPSEF